MKKLEVITRPEKLEALAEALEMSRYSGMNITNVKGYGSQKGMEEKKVKIEIVIQDDKIEKALEIVLLIAKTGNYGDGKIFLINIEDAIRIRTKERGEIAV
jgi:nitrogen regulatory protein P-II 1